MKNKQDGIEFTLNNPISYSVNGQFIETTKINLYSPSRKNIEYARRLEQLVTRAAISAQGFIRSNVNQSEIDNVNKKEDNTINPEEMISILKVSDDDITNFYTPFKKLILNGGAKLNNDIQINEITYNQIDTSDEERMLGFYLANFLATS